MTNEYNQLKANNLAMQEEMTRTWEKLDNLKQENINLSKEIDYWTKKYNDEFDKLKELRDWLELRWEQTQDVWFVKIINKMNELERVEK